MENQPPSSPQELQTAIDTLLCQAHANGVEVATHAYVLRHDDTPLPDWEVVITRLSSQ